MKIVEWFNRASCFVLRVIVAVVFWALITRAEAAEALPRTVTVTPGTYKVAYPTNFWDQNAADITNALGAIGFGTNAGGGGIATTSPNPSPVLGAFSFREALSGFPGPDTEESGRFIYSTDFGKTWEGGTGYPTLKGVSGSARDIALTKIGNLYYAAYTTNSASISNGSVAIAIHCGTNLNALPWKTNVGFEFVGETLVLTNTLTWSPQWWIVGGSLRLSASVMTNAVRTNGVMFTARAGSQFQTRTKLSSTNDPLNFAAGSVQLLNNSGIGNMLDLTPFVHTNGTVYAWFKNETNSGGATENLGVFASTNPASSFTILQSGLDGGTEGNWMVQLPGGTFRRFTIRYYQQYNGGPNPGYGNNGDGNVLCFSEANTINGSWSSLTNCVMPPFYAQSFKPYLFTSGADVANALAAGGKVVRGTMNIQPEIGTSLSGITYGGWAGTNGGTGDLQGVNTNDYARLTFAAGGRGGNIFTKGDMSMSFYLPSLDFNDADPAGQHYLKRALTINSNRADFVVQPYYNGTALGGGAPVNVVTNPYNAATFVMTNTGYNAPAIELFSSAAISGNQLGPFMRWKIAGNPYSWAFGATTLSNQFQLQLGENPYTVVGMFHTNGAVDFAGSVTAASFIGNGSGLTGIPLGALPSILITNNFVGDFILAPYSAIRSGLNGFSETNFWGTFVGTFSGNGANVTNVNAGSLTGTVTNAIRTPTAEINNASVTNFSFFGSATGVGFRLSAVDTITYRIERADGAAGTEIMRWKNNNSAIWFPGSATWTGTITPTNGLVLPSQSLTFVTASGLFTNGSHWMGTISNQLYAGYMTNNVATFTNLWSH